jgi:hypothetical protein
MWIIGWAPKNVNKWQMGFNSVFKGLKFNHWYALSHYSNFVVDNSRSAGHVRLLQDSLLLVDFVTLYIIYPFNASLKRYHYVAKEFPDKDPH